MEEALVDTAGMRRFAQLGGLADIPDETTILNFRRLLETHGLAEKLFQQVNAHLQRKGLSLRSGTIVDATIISAPSSTKNQDGQRDPEMHQTKKGNQWHFGMKAHIGVDDASGLVHHVTCAAANVSDVTQAHTLLHGEEDTVCGDSGYTGADKRGVAACGCGLLDRGEAVEAASDEEPARAPSAGSVARPVCGRRWSTRSG